MGEVEKWIPKKSKKEKKFEEIKNKIFEPFFTTKKHGEGIGLGLDITKKIINQLGGKIEFESVPGRTKFSVFLRPAESKIGGG